MERKTLKLEVKGLDEAGTFTGYVAVTGNKDLGGDVIEPGAFAKTLKDHDGKVVLLDSHDSYSGRARLGILHLSEDSKGLKVDKGVLNLQKASAQEAYADLRFYHENGLPLGMSIGYDAIQKSYETDKGGNTIRRLKEVALWEGSLVTFPMNPKARVTNVKAFEQLAEPFDQLLAELKAGRMISAANMEKLKEAMSGMHAAMEQIVALVEAASEEAPKGTEPTANTSAPEGPISQPAAAKGNPGPDQVHPVDVKALLAKIQETSNLFSTRRSA